MNETTLPLILTCVDLPDAAALGLDDLRLGVQRGKEVEQDLACQGQPIFRLDLLVGKDGDPAALRGPYVHGLRGEKFLYLCWGFRRAGAWQPHSRAKLQLATLPLILLEQAITDSLPLRLQVHLTGKKGQPAAASLPPAFLQWSLDT